MKYFLIFWIPLYVTDHNLNFNFSAILNVLFFGNWKYLKFIQSCTWRLKKKLSEEVFDWPYNPPYN